MNVLGLLNRRTFSHGIHPDTCKESTRDLPIRRLPFAPGMIIPLSQHAGAPAIPIVLEKQEVVRGEPIAQANGFMSVPMHAPVTGRVERIGLALTPKGYREPAIFLRTYPGASQEVLYGTARDIDAMTPEALVLAVQETGVVGLGGAAFPTHVKLKVPEGKRIDTVLVNGCECEPYLTTDHRVMVEQPEKVIAGTRIVMRALGAARAIVVVEDNKPDAAAALNDAIGPEHPITVESLRTKYPQGAEKMICKALLEREIPSGGLPADVGAAVFNVATLAQIGDLLPRQRGLIERVVTVSGTGVRKPGNYLTALGTPVRFVLEQAEVVDDVHEVVFGGPMMGSSIALLDVPITKGITGILAMAPKGTAPANGKVYPCIKCGECLRACPMHLNPSRLGILAENREYAVMENEYHLRDCFECGCCSFVCPSNIPLVQHFRVAKAMNRERKEAACP